MPVVMAGQRISLWIDGTALMYSKFAFAMYHGIMVALGQGMALLT